MAKDKSKGEFTEDLRKLAKEKLKNKIVPLRQDMDVAELIAELHTNEIELEMQNEQLRRTQEELEKSRHKYADLFDFAPIGYFVLDKKRVIVEANLAGAALLGTEKDNLINMPFSTYVDKSSSDALYLHQQKVFVDGEKDECELKLVRNDGTFIYARLICEPVKDADGNIIQCRTAVIDITSRKQAEEELKQARQQLQDIIDGTTTAIILVKDLEGRYIAANRCFEKLVGIPREKLRGKTDYEVLPKGQADMCRSYDKQALENSPVQAEETLSFINGKEHVFLAHKFPLYDPQGKAYAVCTIAPEITQRKQLEQELRKAHDGLEAKVKERTGDLNEAVGLLQDEIDRRKKTQEQLSKSEQRYRSLVEASAQIIWTTNAKGEMVEENPSWIAFTGQTFEQGKGLGWFNVIHPDDKEYANTLMQEAIKLPKAFETEVRARRSDGQYRYLTVKAVPVVEKDGSVREWIGTCTDITERRQAQEKIEQDARKLRSLTTQLIITEEQQRRRIAETLHDSIGPLLAFSERQLESLAKQAPEKMAGVLEEIRHYINNVTRQTRSLTSDLSPSSLYDLGLEAAVEELAEQFAKEHKLKVFLKISDEPKPLTDETKILLYRSIREILVNTAKHAGAKTVRISLARIERNIVIALKDDGKGFDPSSLDKAAKSKGLGLFSIRERLTQLDGCLEIQSQEGKGTTITLTAPLNPAGQADE
jgi:PAS domain S-box-containing protein